MAGYVDFINSMLNLREQRLKEEQLKQAERLENQQQMMKTISNAGSSIGSYFGTMGENQTARKLGKEFYGADVTGGMPELKMRMGMEAQRGNQMKDAISSGNEAERIRIAQAHLGLAENREGRVSDAEATRLENAAKTLELREQAAARAQEAAALRLEQKQVDDAMKTYQATSQKYKDYKTGASAFNKQIPVTMKAIQHSVDAGDQEGYMNALSELDAHYQAATSQGLKVQMPKIASFQELLAAKAKQEEIDAANAGYYFSTKAQEQAEAARKTKELESMPGYLQHPARINADNYLATPPIEEPAVPDIEAIRAGARTNPALGASPAAPAPD